MVINKKKSKTTKKKKVKKSSNASSAKRIKKHQGKELKVRKSIEVKDKVKEKSAARKKISKTKKSTTRQRRKEPPVTVRHISTVRKARLSKEDLDYFKRILLEKKQRIIEKARSTIDEGMKLDESELPDEYDLASSEYLQYFTLRLRGRERYFLDKIEKALERIENNTFGICEACGEGIGMGRLMARPETTLCIRCKESQERQEKQFSE